jgi:hypothetical protein
MRNLLFTLAVVLGLLMLPHPDNTRAAAFATTVSASSLDGSALDQQPAPQINVEVQHGGRAWYVSPIWIAVGVLALVVLVLLIVMAARGGGGGTTIVKD